MPANNQLPTDTTAAAVHWHTHAASRKQHAFREGESDSVCGYTRRAACPYHAERGVMACRMCCVALRLPTGPVRLTSQYERGVKGADVAAADAAGRDWYREDNLSDVFTDQDVPEWPPCAACGHGVDWINEPHWFHQIIGGALYLHDDQRCVTLVYPESER